VVAYALFKYFQYLCVCLVFLCFICPAGSAADKSARFGDSGYALPQSDFTGATAGEFGVTPGGMASYAVPITVPVGTTGVQPKLTLQFSSSGNKGVMGYGSSIGGISYITRCPKDKYHDNAIDPVDFDAEDKFCLNGQRLVAVSGAYGANETEYRTSFEEFTKVVSYETSGNGPKRFQVWKKSGEIIEYGNTTDSRILRKSGSEVRVWAMNKLQDTAGNYVTFAYFHDGGPDGSGEFGIQRVDYTGNSLTGLLPYNRVDFIYAPAPKAVDGWFSGEQYKQTKRLTNVKVYAEDALFRDYRLAYRSDFQLSSLTECAAAACFAPTTFDWMSDENIQPAADNLFKTSALTTDGITGSVYAGYTVAGSGDFNGDGLTDMYMMKVDGYGRKPSTAATEHVWLGKSNGTFDDIDLGISGSLPNEHYKIVASGDFNGDGRTDLYAMRVQNDAASRARDNSYDRVLLGQSNGSFTQIELVTPSQTPTNYTPGQTPVNYKVASSGDFNGDGRTDLYFFESKASGKTSGNAADYVLLASGDGSFDKVDLTFSGGLTGPAQYDEYDVVSGGDFNGDGLTDLYVMRISTKNGGAKYGTKSDFVWLADGTGSFTSIDLGANFVEGTSGGAGSTPSGFKVGSTGDFNGDGLTDLYLFKVDDFGRSVGDPDDYVRMSKGNGYFDIKLLSGGMTGINYAGYSIYDGYSIVSSGDFNSDGLTDLYILCSDTKGRKTGNSMDRVWLAKGDGEFIDTPLLANAVEEQTQQLSVSSAPAGYRVATSGDVNGDGLTDLYLLKTDDYGRSNGNPNDYVFYGDYKQKELIKAITNGLGNKAEVEYKPLTDPAVYTKGAGSIYPVADVTGASYVISKVKADNGIGGQNTQTYTYEGLRTHQDGIGNLGFAKMTVMDDSTGIASESVYSQDHAAKTHGLLTRSHTIAPGGVVLEDKQVTWAVQTLPALENAPRYFRKSTLSKTTKRDLNNALLGETTETFTYEDCAVPSSCFGLVTGLTVSTSLEAGTDTFTKTTANTYFAPDLTRWISGRLKDATVVHFALNTSNQTRKSSFTYDGNGLLLTETIEPGDALFHTKTYQRDATGSGTHGAVTSVTETWGSEQAASVRNGSSTATSRTTSYAYDAKFRYKQTETNPLGHAQSTQYHPLHGLPVSTTGPNGLTTSWLYDDFGRITQETRADSTTTKTYQYKCDADTPCPTNSSYVVVTVATGAPLAAAYMDKLHRTIRKTAESRDGQLIDVDTEFDALGRERRVSEPHFDGATVYWTVIDFDILGRPVLTTRPDLSTQSVVYNGLTQVSTNELSQTKTVVNDVAGRMVSSKDAYNETVTYQYDAIGQMTAIIDPAGNTTTMAYDVRGAKTAMSDPDKGAWSYRYNALGLLSEQTDAKGQVTAMTYDVLGRMLTRIDDATQPGETARSSTWVYDTAVKGVGKLASSSGYGYEASNLYDSLGRPSSATETIDGTGYTTTTTYDASGRPYRTAYASGLTVESVFNEFGHSTEMKNVVSGLVYWRADAADARGNITQATLSAGVANVVENRFYNAQTGRLSSISTAKGSTNLQQLSYQFDALANLTSRTDARQGLSEAFLYDTLNRVTSYTVTAGSGATTVDVTYDRLGNITSKSDVGAYSTAATSICAVNAPRPHAVTAVSGTKNTTYCYDANGDLTSGDGRMVTYSAFGMPVAITQTLRSIEIAYGPDRARFKRVDINETGTKTTRYIAGGALEIVAGGGQTVYKTHVGVAVIIDAIGAQSTTETRYLLKDHLGSTDVILDADGAVVDRMSFDAWGKRREIAWAAFLPVPASLWQTQLVTRGFTGHEQLDPVGLVHMNGRVYDPELGRFLSADPHIQDVTNGQALNRYSYVLNNPLSFTDPSGFFFQSLFKAIGHAVGAVFRAIGRVFSALLKSSIFRSIVQIVACANPYAAATCPAAAAALTLATGGSISDALTAAAFSIAQAYVWGQVGDHLTALNATAVEWATTHGVVSGAFTVAQGGEFHAGFTSGFVGSYASAVTAPGTELGSALGGANSPFRLAVVATSGGLVSELTGGKFANGALTSAFAHIYNCLGHKPCSDGSAPSEGITESAFSPLEIFGLVATGIKSVVTVGVRSLFASKTIASSLDEAMAAGERLAANKATGDRFRDEIADLLRQAGRGVQTEVRKPTIFGTRIIDIEVSYGGRILGGIETKTGASRYLPSQQAKDFYLRMKGYPVNVVRKP